jgi:hypothetical protein
MRRARRGGGEHPDRDGPGARVGALAPALNNGAQAPMQQRAGGLAMGGTARLASPARRAGRAAASLLLLLLACATARAQQDDGVTEHLIQILVKNGVLTQTQAKVLLEEAKREARGARAPAPAAAATAPAAAEKPVPAGSVRVTYVPETVRRQIAAEVKQQVMQQAQDEGWAQPNVMPEWTQRIRVYGDVRVRGDWELFPGSNKGGVFPDFRTINNSPNGFDIAGTLPPPVLNTTEDRFLPGLRVRLGVAAHLADWIDADVRLATGVGNNPVSPNQVLGQPGDFRGYAIWVDRADIAMRPMEHVTAQVGRMPNPFWTSDMMYDPDLNFDGVAVQASTGITDRLSGFLTLGGFPVFNTDFNLGSTNTIKTSSHDQYLLAAQGGLDWRVADDTAARVAAGYFAYVKTQGQLSQPCVNPTSFGSCSSDETRASFVQFGNTLFPIRNIDTLGGTVTAQPQYYGLAAHFNVLDLRGRVVYSRFLPVNLVPEIEFAQNLAFDRKQIGARGPVNNLDTSGTRFTGGNSAYSARLLVGALEPAKAWEWNVTVGYKYLASDSVVDALTDSRFHFGGTNAKGYFLIANLALAKNVWMTGRWYSTTVVSGPPYSEDSAFLELNALF